MSYWDSWGAWWLGMFLSPWETRLDMSFRKLAMKTRCKEDKKFGGWEWKRDKQSPSVCVSPEQQVGAAWSQWAWRWGRMGEVFQLTAPHSESTSWSESSLHWTRDGETGLLWAEWHMPVAAFSQQIKEARRQDTVLFYSGWSSWINHPRLSISSEMIGFPAPSSLSRCRCCLDSKAVHRLLSPGRVKVPAVQSPAWGTNTSSHGKGGCQGCRGFWVASASQIPSEAVRWVHSDAAV